MESLTLQPIARVEGTVNLPGSKSVSNRALLLAALARGTTVLTNLLDSDDVRHMLNALSALGVQYTLSADRTRFTAGTGPYVAPYLNFWITDGVNYAVVANEPSDGNFQPLYSNGYSLSFADLSDKAAKIFENADKSWLPNNGVGLTFAAER